ncbi:MAG: tetratricopeptide repeat protein [Candidatus Hydrogenedentes bacterium]|nr:tetratricopeptide repeat protein [Candidatus Hydrogenedentota bacterium]
MDSSEAQRKFKLADELFRDKRYTEALTVLDKLDTAFPDAKNVMYPRALCLMKLGRPKEAHEICLKLKSKFNDPRADKILQKLSASTSPVPPPPVFNPNAPGQDIAFNPMDLSMDPIGTGGADPMGLGDLFAPKPDAAPPPAVAEPNRKPLYIGLGVAGGVLLLALIALPLFFGKDGGSTDSGGGTATQTAADPAAAPQEIYWFNSYDTAMNASYDKLAPTLYFFYNSESEAATQMMQDTWKEPSIAHLVDGWTCVRIDTEADPENTSWYEVTEIPTTIVEDSWTGEVYRQSGYVSAQEFYNAIQPLDLKVEEMVDFTQFTIAQLAIVVVLLLLESATGMYLTLLLVKKLPNEEFLKDFVSAGLVGVGVSVLFSCPCIGLITAYFILHALYEFEFIDYVAYLGVTTVLKALTSVLVAGVLGIPVEVLLEFLQ